MSPTNMKLKLLADPQNDKIEARKLEHHDPGHLCLSRKAPGIPAQIILNPCSKLLGGSLLSQRSQYPLSKEYTLNHNIKASII